MRAQDADVAIVGSGPAGTSAAIACASAGLRVLQIEREEFPRNRPGETLHPGVSPLLNRLGVEVALENAGFLRHAGNRVVWGGPPRFGPFGSDATGPWREYQAWRADFDAILLGRALACGATILQPCRAFAPRLPSGAVIGVETESGPVHARFVIDAAGGRHWLARSLGIGVERHSPRLIARFGYVEGDCPDCHDTPTIRADPRGWTWIARVRVGVYQWTRLDWSARTPREVDPPDELKGLAPRGPTLGSDVTWRKARRPAGPGYFLAGDAAAVLDPASSHGVLKSLMSGMYAAHLIVAVMLRGVSPDRVATAYGRWLEDWFHFDVERLRSLYATASGTSAWAVNSPTLGGLEQGTADTY